jgi:hypothetical protein
MWEETRVPGQWIYRCTDPGCGEEEGFVYRPLEEVFCQTCGSEMILSR